MSLASLSLDQELEMIRGNERRFFMPRSLRNFPTVLPGNVPKARLKMPSAFIFQGAGNFRTKDVPTMQKQGNENSRIGIKETAASR